MQSMYVSTDEEEEEGMSERFEESKNEGYEGNYLEGALIYDFHGECLVLLIMLPPPTPPSRFKGMPDLQMASCLLNCSHEEAVFLLQFKGYVDEGYVWMPYGIIAKPFSLWRLLEKIAGEFPQVQMPQFRCHFKRLKASCAFAWKIRINS